MLSTLFLTFVTISGMPGWASDAQLATGIDPRLILALCTIETGGRVDAYTPHDGHSESFGLCQVKLNTARSVGFIGAKTDLQRPTVNAIMAARYLKKLYYKHRSLRSALAAYNAGHLGAGNEQYVNKVLTEYKKLGGSSL